MPMSAVCEKQLASLVNNSNTNLLISIWSIKKYTNTNEAKKGIFLLNSSLLEYLLAKKCELFTTGVGEVQGVTLSQNYQDRCRYINSESW